MPAPSIATEPRTPALLSALRLMQSVWPGPLALQAVHVAAKLGLADIVASGPKTVTELAEATVTHAPSLRRLLRALVSIGVFAKDGPDQFRQSELSDLLRTEHPQSLRSRALMLGSRFVWRPSGELEAAIRSGQTPFEQIFGAPFFGYLAEHQDDAAIFAAGVTSMPASIDAVLDAYDFSRFERIVDVGGGRGALLTAILSAHPDVHGVLYDLPTVIVEASLPRDGSVAERLALVAGDFLTAVPAGAGAYLLSHVLHDWSDDDVLRILRNCRRAMCPGARLLVFETLPARVSHPTHEFMDLLMMILTGGRERTESEFRQLLRDAGFVLMKVKPTISGTLLEGRAQ